MAQTLDSRINAALRSAARLKDVESVISDVKAEMQATRTKLDAENARSIDPALTTAEAREARNNAADLEHDLRRLDASLGMLNERRASLLKDAEQARCLKEYEATTRETDDLAKLLRDRVPPIFSELVDILRRIEANDARVAAANANRPSGAAVIPRAEQAARGYIGVGSWPNMSPVERLTAMMIPRFDGDGRLWPRSHAPTPMAFPDVFSDAIRQREASKVQYTVQRTDKRMGQVVLHHADGVFNLGYQAHTCWLYPGQVQACKAAGMTLTPVAGAEVDAA